MNPFDYERASDAEGAVATVVRRPGAAFLGGGTNLVDHMKLGVATPDLLVDITRLPFDSVEPTGDGGVRIGTTVRNSDLAADPLIRGRYPVLSQALPSPWSRWMPSSSCSAPPASGASRWWTCTGCPATSRSATQCSSTAS